MATIHLIHGFMGFGKTTLAKELAKKYHAKHFCIDHIMLEKYGRTPQDFQKAFQETDDAIWQEAAKCIQAGQDVILDYGFGKEKRAKKCRKKPCKSHHMFCGIN